MNILFIGLLGSGKTSVARNLAEKIGYKFIELDHDVLHITGYDNVEELFKKKKSLWEECELEITKDLSCDDNQVIACGGGMVLNHLNIQYFKENSEKFCVIYLETGIEELVKRVHHREPDTDELEIKQRIEKLLKERDFIYRHYADYIVKTDQKTIRDLVLEVEKLIHKK